MNDTGSLYPSQPPWRVVAFDACTVELFNDRVITTFHDDGSRSMFMPPRWSYEWRQAARYAGYADDDMRHAYEHEILHAWLAQELGRPYSYSVWSDAHATWKPGRPWSQRVADEEHLVVSLQRYINTGDTDAYGRLPLAFGPALPAVALRALLALRPWLALP